MRAVVLALVLLAHGSVPGRDLRLGMRLTYASGGEEQPAWRVDSLVRDLAHEGRTGCLFVRFSPTDSRTVCASGDTIFAWSPTTRRWTPSRIVAPNATLEIRQASLGRVVFTTGAMETDTISAVPIPVVVTRVSTFDSSGRELRRLDERYAPGLLTATSGAFAVPDTARAGGWRVTTRFELVRIE